MGTQALPASEVRDAFLSLGRALKRVALYRSAPGRYAEVLEPALAPLQTLLARQPALTLSVLPTALVYEGEPVLGEPAREGSLCFHLHRDGVRSLTFLAGLDLFELIVFVTAALPQGPGGAGREDAVTELWKADLRSVHFAAVSGYRLEEEGASADPSALEGIAAASARAQQALDQHGHGAEEERLAQATPPLMTPAELAAFDPQDWAALAGRTSALLLDIVARDAAGRDLASLTETLGRLADEMLAHGATSALTGLLIGVTQLEGERAQELRAGLSAHLGDPARLGQLLDLSARPGPVLEQTLPAWLALLPPESGERLLDLLQARGTEASAARLAGAAVDRLWSCRAPVETLLRAGAEPAARLLLEALGRVAEPVRASVAAHALSHPSLPVRLAAVPLVSGDPAAALRHLGPLLRQADAKLRLAAVEALGGCAASEGAARLILSVLQGPDLGRASREEQIALHRALGRQATPLGLRFLQERLTGTGGLFRRRNRLDDESLLAVQGLVADGSPRAIEILEEAARSSPHLRVSASSRAAARLLRTRPPEAA